MRTMLKGLTAVVFAAGLTAAAQAETKPGAPAPAPTAPAGAKQVKDKLYCVESTHTGTRIRRKNCQTRAEWLREGFDPLDPK